MYQAIIIEAKTIKTGDLQIEFETLLTSVMVFIFSKRRLSHCMGKPTICIGKTKAQISFSVAAKLISAFVFASRIVQFLYFLNPKFPASNHLLCLYSLVCVGPGRNPKLLVSHAQTHLLHVVLVLPPKAFSLSQYDAKNVYRDIKC